MNTSLIEMELCLCKLHTLFAKINALEKQKAAAHRSCEAGVERTTAYRGLLYSIKETYDNLVHASQTLLQKLSQNTSKDGLDSKPNVRAFIAFVNSYIVSPSAKIAPMLEERANRWGGHGVGNRLYREALEMLSLKEAGMGPVSGHKNALETAIHGIDMAFNYPVGPISEEQRIQLVADIAHVRRFWRNIKPTSKTEIQSKLEQIKHRYEIEIPAPNRHLQRLDNDQLKELNQLYIQRDINELKKRVEEFKRRMPDDAIFPIPLKSEDARQLQALVRRLYFSKKELFFFSSVKREADAVLKSVKKTFGIDPRQKEEQKKQVDFGGAIDLIDGRVIEHQINPTRA